MTPLTKKLMLFALVSASILWNQVHSNAGITGSVQVQIIADPPQSFVVCARDVQADGTVILTNKRHSEPPDKPASITFLTTQPETHLQVTSPSQCTPEQIQQHRYPGKAGLHSESPFMSIIVHNDKKKDRQKKIPKLNNQGFQFPINPPSQYILTGSGGTFGSDDDDKHWRPYGGAPEASGDVDLTLIGGFQLPEVLGDYLPDHTSWQSMTNLLGMGDSQSNTLWVYPGSQPGALTSIQVNPEEMAWLAENLSGDKPLEWLLPKLRPDHRQELIQYLLNMQDVFTNANEDVVLSEPVLELIRERLVEVLDKSSTEIDLEFEYFRLRRDLEETADEVKESLVLAHRPDTDVVYKGKEVDKYFHRTPDGQKSGHQENRGAGLGQTSSTRSGNGGDAGFSGNHQGESSDDQRENDDEEVKSKKAATVESTSENVDSLRIVFFGPAKSGKSSLANRLIGFDYFPTMLQKEKAQLRSMNQIDEPSYHYGEVIIDSLTGYNQDLEEPLIPDALNKQSNVIVYVTSDSLEEEDEPYIKHFIDMGLRVVYVWNKAQAEIDGRLYDRRRKNIITLSDSIDSMKEEFKKNYEHISGQQLNDLILSETVTPTELRENSLTRAIEGVLREEEKKQWDTFKKVPDLLVNIVDIEDKFERASKTIEHLKERLAIHEKTPLSLEKIRKSPEFIALEEKIDSYISQQKNIQFSHKVKTVATGAGAGAGTGAVAGTVAGTVAGAGTGAIAGSLFGACIGGSLAYAYQRFKGDYTASVDDNLIDSIKPLLAELEKTIRQLHEDGAGIKRI